MTATGKIVLSAVIAVAIAIAAVGLYKLYDTLELIDAGEEFGKDASIDECLFQLARDTSSFNDVEDMKPSLIFAASCVEIAPGDPELYCDGPRVKKTLPRDYCAEESSNKLCPAVISGTLLAYCVEIDFDRPDRE